MPVDIVNNVESPDVTLPIKEQNRLIEAHIALAKSRASAHRASSNLPYEDLLSEAYLSLVKAARRYNPNMGVTFGAYAKAVINGYLLNFLRDKSRNVKVPRRYSSIYLRIRKAERTGKGPMTAEQLSQVLGIDIAEIVATKQAMESTCSQINEQIVETPESSTMELDHLDQDTNAMLLALDSLSLEEINLLTDAFVHSKSSKSIARAYGIKGQDLENTLVDLLARVLYA